MPYDAGRDLLNDRDTGHLNVAYVAHLARLQLSEEETRTFQSQLEQVLGYVEKIRALSLDNVEPMSHAHPLQNVFRRDEVRPGLDRDAVLANAPARVGEQISVPRIVE
jgi:aspartyl-tRNA(Asn)/glutamyl-tRNA(Gln) amidotransferase subunit C